MQITSYIISYLPDDALCRQIRLNTIQEQLKEWLDNTNLDINIIAMNWTPNELNTLPITPRIIPHRHPRLPCTQARYECHKLFYASNYKWGVFMDDDACLYPHNSSYKMFEEMDKHIEDYKDITAFWPLNPTVVGFNKFYKEDPRYETHHIFSKLITPKGTMCVLRNLQLYGEEPMFNDLEFDMMEDVAFAIKLRYNGHNIYTTANLVLKELNHGASFFGAAPKLGGDKDESKRIANAKAASAKIVAKYPDLLEETTKGITINQSQLISRKGNPGFKKQFIPKDGVYDNSIFNWELLR